MLDSAVRGVVGPGLDRAAAGLERARLTPAAVTLVALALGIGACVAYGAGLHLLALGLWLLNRLLDGLDGPLARRIGASDFGSVLDFTCDFVVYAGFVVAVAVDQPQAELAACVLLATYLVNNVLLLSFSSVVEKRGLTFGDERGLRFTSGLAEGTETIAVYCLLCLLPAEAEPICWAWAGVVACTCVQRLVLARRTLT